MAIREIRAGEPGAARALSEVAVVEAAADQLFAEVMDISRWAPPAPGETRVRDPGVLLVAEGGPAEGGEPTVVGFVHALELEGAPGHWHLEQLAVHPDHLRRAIGTDLLDAAEAHARQRGGRVMTVLTYRDVPWNAPYYARSGYEVVDPAPSFMDGVVASEDPAVVASGPRVAMVKPLVEPVVPRVSVSVIPLRDGSDGLEVFVQHRATTMDFAAGAVVFPGGRVDEVDQATPVPVGEADVLAWARTPVARAEDPARELGVLLAAAVRELAEETGVDVEPARLLPWDSWVTPAGSPRRFDVSFFVLPVREDLGLANTTSEARHAGWEPVARLLEDRAAGRLTMLTPTRVILEELAALDARGGLEVVVARRPVIVPGRRDGARVRPSREE